MCAHYQHIDCCQYVEEAAVRTQPTEVCCAPLTAGALTEDEADELAGLLKVLADPARLRLLSMVAAAEAGEACACDLVEPVGRSQPTVSHHLSLLVDAGLLTREKRGRWAWYRVVPERLAGLRDALDPATRPAGQRRSS
jgi:ArsR family transcriptional regulator, arsenate/arsenite/antimonite-responsive transcriptional repressor